MGLMDFLWQQLFNGKVTLSSRCFDTIEHNISSTLASAKPAIFPFIHRSFSEGGHNYTFTYFQIQPSLE